MRSEKIVELIEQAAAARESAYAPYSKFRVGAALLLRDGSIVTGCNVENASYGLCLCAERTAIVKAVSEGFTDFEAIAVATIGGGTPCGACRQFLSEFCNPQTLVVVHDVEKNSNVEYTLEALLPDAFRFD